MNIATLSPKPRIILGLMTFGPNPSKGARITDIGVFQSCLTELSSRGYNELDTARVYIDGAQEAFTAAAGFEEKGFAIATKVYPTPPYSHEPTVLRQALETSLRELGLGEGRGVDIFYLHAADRGTNFEETLRECDSLFREEKFTTLGLSNFTAFEVAEVQIICRERGWVRPRVYQGMYNCISMFLLLFYSSWGKLRRCHYSPLHRTGTHTLPSSLRHGHRDLQPSGRRPHVRQNHIA